LTSRHQPLLVLNDELPAACTVSTSTLRPKIYDHKLSALCRVKMEWAR